MITTEKRTDLAEALMGAGLVAVCILTGVPTGPGKAMIGLLAGVAGNWAFGLSQHAFRHYCDRWFTADGVLNHDIARALELAFRNVVTCLRKSWPRTQYYRLLRSRDRAAADLTLETLETLEKDAEWFFRSLPTLDGSESQADLTELLKGDLADVSHRLDSDIADYLYGHDPGFVEFVQKRLPNTWAQGFVDVLRDPGEQGTRAWRAYQSLWQTSMARHLQQLSQDVQETRLAIEQLVSWVRRSAADPNIGPSVDLVLPKVPKDIWQPRAPISHFIGREAELLAYKAILNQTHWVAIRGMAGAGKTTLGRRLVEMEDAPSDQVFWFEFNETDSNTADAMYWAMGGYLESQGKPDLMRYLRAETKSYHMLDTTTRLSLFMSALGSEHYLLCFDRFEIVRDAPDIVHFFQQIWQRYVAQQQPLPARFILMGREFGREMPSFSGDQNTLTGFCEREALDFMSSRGISLASEIAGRLWKQTEGNPMLLLLSASALGRLAGDPRRTESLLEALSSSQDIRSYLMSQVCEALPPGERTVLDVLSVLTPPITREAVEAVLEGEKISHVVQLVDSFATHPFVTEDAGRLTCHSLVREYCYRVLDGDTRLQHHQHAASHFERQKKFLESAFHYLRCGCHGHALDMLTDNAQGIINDGGAETLLDRLGQLSELLLETQQRMALEMTKGIAHHMRGRYKQALEAFSSALDEVQDDDARADILRHIGIVYRDWGQLDRAVEYLRRSLATSLACHDETRTADVHYYLGRTYYRLDDLDQACKHLTQAYGLALKLNDRLLQAKTKLGLGTVEWREGNLVEAEVRLEESISILRHYGDRPREARARGNLARIYGERGDRTLELATYEDVRRIQEEIGDLYSLLITYNNLGNLHQLLENYPQAERYYYQLSLLAQDVNHIPLLCTAYTGLADAYLAMKKPKEALQYASQAESFAQELGSGVEQGVCFRVMGDICVELSRLDEAGEYYQRSLSLLEDAHEVEEFEKVRCGLEELQKQTVAM